MPVPFPTTSGQTYSFMSYHSLMSDASTRQNSPYFPFADTHGVHNCSSCDADCAQGLITKPSLSITTIVDNKFPSPLSIQGPRNIVGANLALLPIPFSEIGLAKASRDNHLKGLLSVLSSRPIYFNATHGSPEPSPRASLLPSYRPPPILEPRCSGKVRLPDISYVLHTPPPIPHTYLVQSASGPITSPLLSPITRGAVFAIDSSAYTRICNPLARWVAEHLWRVITTGLTLSHQHPSSRCHDQTMELPSQPLPVLTESICSLLLSTLLQPSVIIQSLYYISRLPAYICASAPDIQSRSVHSKFRSALISVDATSHNDPITKALYSAFKLFVVGAILSNKVLDDHVFTLKTWHEVSGIPLAVLNRLEWLSLDILNHDLLVDSASWKNWIRELSNIYIFGPLLFSTLDAPGRDVIHHIFRAMSKADTSSKPYFLGLDVRIEEMAGSCAESAGYACDFTLDQDGPLREEYLPKCKPSKIGQSVQISDVRYSSHDPPSPQLDNHILYNVPMEKLVGFCNSTSSPLTPLDPSYLPFVCVPGRESACYCSSNVSQNGSTFVFDASSGSCSWESCFRTQLRDYLQSHIRTTGDVA